MARYWSATTQATIASPTHCADADAGSWRLWSKSRFRGVTVDRLRAENDEVGFTAKRATSGAGRNAAEIRRRGWKETWVCGRRFAHFVGILLATEQRRSKPAHLDTRPQWYQAPEFRVELAVTGLPARGTPSAITGSRHDRGPSCGCRRDNLPFFAPRIGQKDSAPLRPNPFLAVDLDFAHLHERATTFMLGRSRAHGWPLPRCCLARAEGARAAWIAQPVLYVIGVIGMARPVVSAMAS